MIEHHVLLEKLRYEPDDGNFYWRVSPRNGVFAGDIAGCEHGEGYKTIGINGRSYLSHRLAWFYIHGAWPGRSYDIDHINGDRADNRITNLRLASRSQNLANSISTRAKSGFRGVHWNSRDGVWIAKITIQGTPTEIGRFENREAAASAYRSFSISRHGKFSGAASQCDFEGKD